MKVEQRRVFLSLAAIALVVVAINLADAGGGGGSGSSLTDCRDKIALAATSAGKAIDTSGTAEVRARDSREKLKVSMDARVDAGTQFLVRVRHMFIAGTITIDPFGNGELEVKNFDGLTLPAGVAPICTIDHVEVWDGGGNLILSGSF